VFDCNIVLKYNHENNSNPQEKEVYMERLLKNNDFVMFFRVNGILSVLAIFRIMIAGGIAMFWNVAPQTIERVFYIIVIVGMIVSAPALYERKWVKITITSSWLVLLSIFIYYTFLK
jgi:hypothetical protein